MTSVLACAAYLPHHRLDRRAIHEALGAGGGKGTRTVASFDEDATSMGVEAARRALAALPPGSPTPTAVFFATSDPPYLEKSNASVLHAALGLDQSVVAYDFGGAVRSGVGILRTALERPGVTLVVASDVRNGLPGGSDESAGGDAAVAFVTGTGVGIADLLATGAVTTEILDRWRLPGESAARSWEERFSETILAQHAQTALDDALKQAGVAQPDVAAVAGASVRAVKSLAGGLARRGTRLVDLDATVGFTGAAHVGLLLVGALEGATVGEVVVVVGVADGADAMLFRAAAPAPVGPQTLRAQLDCGGRVLPYTTYLTWRGHLTREPPRRPDNERPDAPASLRGQSWKYGFVGSRCRACDRRHLPPQRVCIECGAADDMAAERMADCAGTVVTYTVDRLSFSLNPPVVAAVVEFDDGGRFQCELTDVDPDVVHVGQRVEMSFRRMYTAQGVHNYFWKAKPIQT